MYPVPVWPNPCYATELSGLYFSDIFGSYFLLKCLIHILLQPNGDFMIYNACDFGLQRFRDSKIRVCWKKFVFLVYIHTSRSFRTLWPSGKLFRPHFGSQHPIIVLIWKKLFSDLLLWGPVFREIQMYQIKISKAPRDRKTPEAGLLDSEAIPTHTRLKGLTR